MAGLKYSYELVLLSDHVADVVGHVLRGLGFRHQRQVALLKVHDVASVLVNSHVVGCHQAVQFIERLVEYLEIEKKPLLPSL